MNRLLRHVACAFGAVLLVVGLTPALGGVATADTTIQIAAKALTSHECDDTEWHFVITQVAAGQAPGSISVSWADSGTEVVPLDDVTGGTAHYSSTLHLDSTVSTATATIYADWSGQFNLSHGPCGTGDNAGSGNGDNGNGGTGGTGGGGNGGEGTGGIGGDGTGDNGAGLGHTPVNVCHATGSATNPYVFIVVDDDSTKFQGHLEHRNEPRNDNTGRDFIGDYTDDTGVFHHYDGDINGIEDCPNETVPPESNESTGSFTLSCPSSGATTLLAAVGTLDSAGVVGHFELRVTAGASTTSHTVTSGAEVTDIPLGATVSLRFVPDSGSPTQVGNSQTGATTCGGGGTSTTAASGVFTVVCDAAGTANAVATVGTLSTGTESGSFALGINGAAQAVTSGQVIDDVALNAMLALSFTPSGGSPRTLDSHTAPTACGTTTTPTGPGGTTTPVGSGGTEAGESPQGGVAPVTEVLGVKQGRSVPSSGQAPSGATGVSPESAGFLPHTGLGSALVWLLAVGGLLLVSGAGLLAAPAVARRRR